MPEALVGALVGAWVAAAEPEPEPIDEPEPEPLANDPLPKSDSVPELVVSNPLPSVRQIFQPDLVTEPSEYHEMVDPAVTATLLGPWLPSNLWLPISSLSYPLSVLNAVELTSPDVPTLIEHV